MKWLYVGLAFGLAAAGLRLLPLSSDGAAAGHSARGHAGLAPSGLTSHQDPLRRYGAALLAFVLFAAAALALQPAMPMFGMIPRRVWAGLAYGFVLTAVVFVMLAKRAPLWSYLPLLLFFIVPQFNPNFFSLFHSFMHISIVYEVFLHGVPPENPLMSGELLRYPNGVHVLIAWLMHVVPISPPVAFALLDAVTLTAFALVAERIARHLSPDRSYRVFAVLLTLFGTDIFVDGPLREIMERIVHGRRFGAPLSLMKFTGINTNQVGLLCVGVAMLALVRLAGRAGNRNASLAIFTGATLGAAVFYQPGWMAIGLTAGLLCAMAILLRWRDYSTDAWLVGVLFLVASAVTSPVWLGVGTGGDASDPAIKLIPTLHHLRVNGKYWLIHIAAPVVLFWLARERMRVLLRERTPVVFVLLVSVAVLQFVYLILYVRFDNEYKFLGFASVSLAPLLAVALHWLYQAHRRTALAACFLFVVPAMTDFTYVTLSQNLSDPLTASGRRVHHRNADEDALYSWIWDKTPTDAVFVDSLLTAPPIAGRRLFVALDVGRDPGMDLGRLHNGWLIDANLFLRSIMAVDAAAHETRRQQATQLLLGAGVAPQGLVDAMLAEIPQGRTLYLIARTPAQRARLAGLATAHLDFERAGRSVYRLGQRE